MKKIFSIIFIFLFIQNVAAEMIYPGQRSSNYQNLIGPGAGINYSRQQAIGRDWSVRQDLAQQKLNAINTVLSSAKDKKDFKNARGTTASAMREYREILSAPYLSREGMVGIDLNAQEIQGSVLQSIDSSIHQYEKAEEKAKSQMLTKIGVGVVLAVVTVATGGLAATGASATLNAIGTVGTYSSFATTALDIRNFSVLQNKGLYAFGQEMKQTSGLSTGLSVTSAVGGVANLYQSAGKFGDEATKQGNTVTELSKEFSVSNAAKIADAKSLQTVYQVKEITTYTQMGVKAASVPQIINSKVYGSDYNRVTAVVSGAIGITDLTYTGPAISKTYYNQDKPLMEKVSVVPSKFAYTSFNPVSVVSITADIKYATTGKNLFAERHQAGASAIMQVADAGYSTAQKIVLNYRVNQASERADNRVEGLMNINAKPGEIKMTEGYETYKYVTDNPSPRDKMATKIKFYESLERNTYLPMPIYQKFENRYGVVDAKIEKPITYNSMMFKTGTGIDTNMGLSSPNNFNVK
ncbi:MAG: hypothetical protein WC976_07085 [Caldisericia bacterium]